MRESKIQKAVNEYARSRGWTVLRLRDMDRNGWPDRTYRKKRRRQKHIEYKTLGEKPTKQQLRRHRELRELGDDVHVIDNIADGKAVFA